MTPQSVASLAVAVGVILGGFFGLLAYDAIKMLFDGHTSTISHSFYVLGQEHPWFPWAMAGGWVVVGLLFIWHFWG